MVKDAWTPSMTSTLDCFHENPCAELWTKQSERLARLASSKLVLPCVWDLLSVLPSLCHPMALWDNHGTAPKRKASRSPTTPIPPRSSTEDTLRTTTGPQHCRNGKSRG